MWLKVFNLKLCVYEEIPSIRMSMEVYKIISWSKMWSKIVPFWNNFTLHQYFDIGWQRQRADWWKRRLLKVPSFLPLWESLDFDMEQKYLRIPEVSNKFWGEGLKIAHGVRENYNVIRQSTDSLTKLKSAEFWEFDALISRSFVMSLDIKIRG